MRRLIWGVPILLILAGSPALAVLGGGATVYVNFDGTNGDGTLGNPYDTLTDAGNAIGGGNVFIIVDGSYNVSITSVPSGTATMPTMIKAQTYWTGVTFTDDIFLDNLQAKFVDFYGIRFEYNGEKVFSGRDIRIFKCVIKNGEPNGNNVKLAIGRGSMNPTFNVLVEGCVIYGSGGRYDALVYNAFNVTFRRNVFRKDGGWDDLGTSNPEANLTVYDSSSAAIINNIVLDSTGSYSTMLGGYYMVGNGTTIIPLSGVHYYGNVCMVVTEYCFRIDNSADSSSNTYVNNLSWNATLGGIAVGNASWVGRMQGFTIGASSPTAGLGIYNEGTFSIKNGILTGLPVDDLDGASATYFDTFNNGAAASGTGSLTINPFTNGLTWLNRIEVGSTLYTAGENGAPMGAMIEKKIGRSGTMYKGIHGSGNWDITTTDDLWPLEDEAAIKAELCSGGVTRGLCASGHNNHTITEYVIGRKANFTSPYTSCTTFTFSPSFANVATTTLDVNYTASGVNNIGVLATDANFSSIISSGVITGTSASYSSLSPSTQYYFEMKVATAADCAYTSAINTTTLAETPAGQGRNINFRGNLRITGTNAR